MDSFLALETDNFLELLNDTFLLEEFDMMISYLTTEAIALFIAFSSRRRAAECL